jgi:hypothetical protein
MSRFPRIDYEARQPEVFDGDAHGYLTAVYQGRLPADYARMKAAQIAIEYETAPAPKTVLTVDIAERLERAIERSNGGRLLTQAKTVEHEPTELAPEPTSASERTRFIPRRRV